MKTTSNDSQQKTKEKKLLCMHSRRKTLFKDYGTRAEHREKGIHVTFPVILLLFLGIKSY